MRTPFLFLSLLAGCAAPVSSTGDEAIASPGGKADDGAPVTIAHDAPGFTEPFMLTPGSGARSGDTMQQGWSAKVYRTLSFSGRNIGGGMMESGWFQDGQPVTYESADHNRPMCSIHVDLEYKTSTQRYLSFRVPIDPQWITYGVGDLGPSEFLPIQRAHAADGSIAYLFVAGKDQWFEEISCMFGPRSLEDVARALNDPRYAARVVFGRASEVSAGGDWTDEGSGGGDWTDEDFGGGDWTSEEDAGFEE